MVYWLAIYEYFSIFNGSAGMPLTVVMLLLGSLSAESFSVNSTQNITITMRVAILDNGYVNLNEKSFGVFITELC